MDIFGQYFTNFMALKKISNNEVLEKINRSNFKISH